MFRADFSFSLLPVCGPPDWKTAAEATGPLQICILAIRVQGTYPARDGEVFECVDPTHAEVFVVFRGFQFALWWGKPDEVRENESLFAGFLAGSNLSRRRIVSMLEKDLELMACYGHGDTGRAVALRELLERLK